MFAVSGTVYDVPVVVYSGPSEDLRIYPVTADPPSAPGADHVT